MLVKMSSLYFSTAVYRRSMSMVFLRCGVLISDELDMG